MSHLPKPDGHQDQRLDDRPPQHPLIGALAGLSEALLTILEGQEDSDQDHSCAHMTEMPRSITSSVRSTHPLIVLLFLDLIHLLHQLSHPQLQLRQLVFGCDFCIVVCMLTNLDVQVNTLHQKI